MAGGKLHDSDTGWAAVRRAGSFNFGQNDHCRMNWFFEDFPTRIHFFPTTDFLPSLSLT